MHSAATLARCALDRARPGRFPSARPPVHPSLICGLIWRPAALRPTSTCPRPSRHAPHALGCHPGPLRTRPRPPRPLSVRPSTRPPVPNLRPNLAAGAATDLILRAHPPRSRSRSGRPRRQPSAPPPAAAAACTSRHSLPALASFRVGSGPRDVYGLLKASIINLCNKYGKMAIVLSFGLCKRDGQHCRKRCKGPPGQFGRG